jgi:hypothetical protein
VKQRLICAILAMVALAAPAAAEPMRFAQSNGPGYAPGALRPREIVEIVRDSGLDPLGRPTLRGLNYVIHAIDGADREVQVIVNARSGDIVRVVPVATASRVPPGGSMGPYERMTPGYVQPGPSGVYRQAPPPGYEDDEMTDYGRPPAPVPGVPLRSGSAPPPPGYAEPRTGNAAPPADAEDAPPSESNTITSNTITSNELAPPSGSPDGLLPPPPERFPQRVAPAAPKAKPIKRAASAAPKPPPLPKPRPGNAAPQPPVEAAAPPSAAAEPPPAPPAEPDANAVPN